MVQAFPTLISCYNPGWDDAGLHTAAHACARVACTALFRKSPHQASTGELYLLQNQIPLELGGPAVELGSQRAAPSNFRLLSFKKRNCPHEEQKTTFLELLPMHASSVF